MYVLFPDTYNSICNNKNPAFNKNPKISKN